MTPGLHFRGDRGGEIPDGAIARLDAAVLGGLEAGVVVGHLQVAVEARSGDATAEGVLVDVHHLGHACDAEAVPDEGEGRSTGVARGCAEDGGVYLHPGGDAQGRRRVADGVEDVAGRAVAAREEQDVDTLAGPSRGQRRRVSPAVVGPVGASTTTVGEKPAARASSSPMSAGHVRMRTSPAAAARTLRASTVRAGASWGAWSWRARESAASPSVPFRPTRPPIPAMGLTIRPTLVMPPPRRAVYHLVSHARRHRVDSANDLVEVSLGSLGIYRFTPRF